MPSHNESQNYVIRGGIQGRERLKLLARIMHSSTASLLDRAGISPGMKCLEIGCGSGDISIELARRVGPHGHVLGVDIDDTKIELARQEAADLNVNNVEFRLLDIRTSKLTVGYDLVYVRFVLTHLSDPASVVQSIHELLKPGGPVIIEDIDFSGHFVYPESPAFNRYHELYCAVVQRRGGNPNIGPQLPLLLKQNGFDEIKVSVVQPMALEGEVKVITPLTLENIADALVQENLSTPEEISQLVQELYDYVANPETLAGLPRVFQTSARRPVSFY
ncbi:MAG TPA: methyltransferase domain-containing protein [Pyrinomonadaceae bacterium]|nr:methyltransferase domain-containing protein [Pyrinomonadaceae bacterium]